MLSVLIPTYNYNTLPLAETIEQQALRAGIVAAIGAAEIALIAATPVPEFALGTKGKEGSGMAIVGERGQEAVFLPHGSKVLPNRQTVQHGELIDAMYDNRLNDYLYLS